MKKAGEWHDRRISKNMTADMEQDGHPKRISVAATQNTFQVLSFVTFVWYNRIK